MLTPRRIKDAIRRSHLGTDTDLAAHVADSDPHTGYLTEAAAASTYATSGHNHTGVYAAASHTHTQAGVTNLTTDLAGKQATLVSGSNIKTVNSASLLGSGDLPVKRWYSITAGTSSSSPADGATAYAAGMQSTGFQTNSTAFVLYIPRAGVIVSANLYLRASGVAGSAENISVYIRHNNTTDYLVQTLGTVDPHRNFKNDAMSITVAAGDYVVFKIVCPTWATNPTNLYSCGTIVVEG